MLANIAVVAGHELFDVDDSCAIRPLWTRVLQTGDAHSEFQRLPEGAVVQTVNEATYKAVLIVHAAYDIVNLVFPRYAEIPTIIQTGRSTAVIRAVARAA